MKIQRDHFEHMRQAIAALPIATVERARYDATHDPRVKDPATRFRWDLFHHAGLTRFACDSLYPYADDSHIDTALRAIVRELIPGGVESSIAPRA